MTPRNGPAHIVVDGSNIGTEGRSMPSLKQLNEAVMSFMEEHPDAAVTVVVDATFGHRIDKKETKEFEEGISNNELVAPPAGAVGRGDAFVLGIADKAGASVLSNDSFQEFHADYEWLFDEGRLIGGKPVPHVGWVWVARTPVRGPVSRKATQGQRGGRSSSRGGRGRNRRDENEIRVGSPEASGPMPVPKSPPPSGQKTASKKSTAKQSAARQSEQPAQRRAPRGGEPVNELLPFLEFVEHHPVGTSVNATVDSYSSHGAYVTIGADGVRGYVPLRMMAEPTPRSAKSIMKVGESVTLVVVSFAGARRSIDCAVPDMADAAIASAKAEADHDDVIVDAATAEQPADEKPPKKPAAKKSAAKKSAAKKSTKTAAKKATVKRATEKKTATKKPAAKKTAAKKTAAKKSAVKKSAAKKSVARKPAAKKTAAKKIAAKKAATSTASTARTRGVTKVAMAKTPVKKAAAANKTVKKSGTKKAAAKKSVAKQEG